MESATRVAGWAVVIAGGAGAMGQVLGDALARAGANVTRVDVGQGPDANGDVMAGDIASPSPALCALLETANAVLFCTPDEVTFANIASVSQMCAPGALLVDTSSSKHQLSESLLESMAASVQYLSLNPLFAPSVGWTGQNVAAIAVRDGARVRAFLAFVEGMGAQIAEVSIDEHQRAMAASQVAVHAAILAYGGALARMGYDVASGLVLSTPPQRTLLAMLARLASGSTHVYYDIQVNNAHGAASREALAAALQELQEALAAEESNASFATLLHRQQDLLGESGDSLRELCKKLYATQFDTGR